MIIIRLIKQSKIFIFFFLVLMIQFLPCPTLNQQLTLPPNTFVSVFGHCPSP